uniref:Retrovirus-related Pol polyprotein from transposon TNT 1-94 n=1 Tax=Vitis vinifera TaxID=29760 RepID=A5AMZ0_VITVI|nr:hypothetical protein VITISV_004700 [Vitis vinifera]
MAKGILKDARGVHMEVEDHRPFKVVEGSTKKQQEVADVNQVIGTKDVIRILIGTTSGFIFTFGGMIVDWRSMEQSYIADSTMKVKCIAASKAMKEVVWLKKFLIGLESMDLGNPLEVVVHYLLIGGMASLSHLDGFPMVSVLVHMVTHWIESTWDDESTSELDYEGANTILWILMVPN